eukprot:CCRYP_012679-RA/>CCRYP_012679-RA protein AED:0.38 eAED:0.38 QI:1539/1/1/1/1/1/2/68/479
MTRQVQWNGIVLDAQSYFATPYKNERKHRKSRPRTQYNMFSSRGFRRVIRAVAAITAVGCAAFSVLPLTRSPSQQSFLRRYHGSKGKYYVGLQLRRPTQWVDVLPADLDALDNDYVMGAVGAQILRFAGWTKSGTTWTKPNTAASHLTLQDRLDRITPTWKSGGTLDYTYDGQGLFAEALSTGTTVEELAQTLESMGFYPQDLDGSSQKALRAMLSWNLPHESTFDFKDDSHNESVILLVFSFDATPFCYSVKDCPLPGPTNELLAETVINFVQHRLGNQTSRVYVISQWEVAAALRQRCTENFWNELTTVPVGTPGKFQNTAEIFGLMINEWNTLIVQQLNHDGADQNTNSLSKALLLSHPDHLRRVFLTAKTILSSKESPSWSPQVLIAPALQPYDLAWPFTLQTNSRNWNLYENVPPTIVHSMGKNVTTNWYDKQYWGYFRDGDPQLWTHHRKVWILYDQWAILKGIVTGTIQSNL